MGARALEDGVRDGVGEGTGAGSVNLHGLVGTQHTPPGAGPFSALPADHPPPGCRRNCLRVGVPGSCHLLRGPHHRSFLYRINVYQQEGQESPIPVAWQPEPNTSSD